MTESMIKKLILARLGTRTDMRIWNNPTGVGLTHDGQRKIAFGLPGSADLTGILGTPSAHGCGCTSSEGRRIEIEVKTPKGKQSVQQQRFQNMIEDMGGIYIVATSADDAVRQLWERGYCRGE